MIPTASINNLAIYRIGTGTPLFIMPYPHAGTFVSIAEDSITKTMLKTGRSVITFDPPGAYNSTREAKVDMQEMIDCTNEVLDYFKISEPIDFLGHSMGSFCALAYAINNQVKIKRLILIDSTTGWKAQKKYGIHKSWKWWKDKEYWLSRFWGSKIYLGFNNLETYNSLNNIVAQASYVNKKYVQLFQIEKNDNKKPCPIRGKWLENVRKYDYRKEIYVLKMPVLICAGLHDTQTPLVMNEELHNRIMNSKLVTFNKSGHFPFIEEEEKFLYEISKWLNQEKIIEKKIDPYCSCPKKCKYHGKCDECYDNHGSKGKLPYCKR